jgi:hypothetical protein
MSVQNFGTGVIHHEDYALAQTVLRELSQLRSRPNEPTADELTIIARKAGLTGTSQRAGRRAVDDIRADAWLAICRLGDAIDKNAVAVKQHRHGDIIELSPLWAAAIDLSQAWVRAAE